MPTDNSATTIGVVLAGGLARRMGGGDKPMRSIGGRTILDHVIGRLQPQCDGLVLNANGDPARFARFALPVIPDTVGDYPGPLAGVLAGLDWAAARVPGATHVASFAGDAPFLPRDLVARLAAALGDGRHALACAASGGRAHPVFGLWPVALRDALRRAVTEEGMRKVDVWTARYALVTVDFATAPIDPFFNANRPDDLAEAERLVTSVLD